MKLISITPIYPPVLDLRSPEPQAIDLRPSGPHPGPSDLHVLDLGLSDPRIRITQYLRSLVSLSPSPDPQILVLSPLRVLIRPSLRPPCPHPQNHRTWNPRPQILRSSTSDPQTLNLIYSVSDPRSWSSHPHNLGSLTLDVSLISVPHVSVSITLIVTHPQLIDLTYSLSYSTVCNIRLG